MKSNRKDMQFDHDLVIECFYFCCALMCILGCKCCIVCAFHMCCRGRCVVFICAGAFITLVPGRHSRNSVHKY